MKCPSKFAFIPCALQAGHESLHMSEDFVLVWGEAEDDVEPEPVVVDLIEEPDEDEDYEVEEVNGLDEYVPVAQYYKPFPHIHFAFRRRRDARVNKDKDCPICVPKTRV